MLKRTEEQTFYDNVSNQKLDTGMVRQARADEMKYVKEMKVYDITTIETCKAETGRAPIGVRWVDIDKGDITDPLYRSRFVAQETR